MTLHFELPINPIPQGRARVTYGHRGVHAYTPQRTTDFYDNLRWALKAAGHKQPPLDGDLELTLRFWRHCRSSANRGDLSNMWKAVEDAANGTLWHDDKQIIIAHAYLEDYGPKTQGRIQLDIRQAASSAKEVNVKT